MSEVQGDRPEEVPPEDRGPRYGRRGYGDDESAWAWWWWVLGIIVIGLIIWWIVAAATPPTAPRVATGPGTGRLGGPAPGPAVAIPAIVGNPNQYMGRSVSVRGAVGQTIGANAFVLQGQGAGGRNAGQSLLVYGPSRVLQSVRSGQSVQATGRVQRFNAAAMQRVIGRQTSMQQLRSWENLPAIEASSVSVLSPPAARTGGGAPRGGAGY